MESKYGAMGTYAAVYPAHVMVMHPKLDQTALFRRKRDTLIWILCNSDLEVTSVGNPKSHKKDVTLLIRLNYN